MRTGPAVPFPFLCDIWGESPEREREKKCWVRSVIGSLIHVFILYVRLCVCVCPPNPAGHLGGLAWSTVPLSVLAPKAESFCQPPASLLEAAALGGCLGTWTVPPQQPWLCPQVGRRPLLSRQPVPWQQEETTPDSSRTWQQIQAQRRPCPGESHPQRRVPRPC